MPIMMSFTDFMQIYNMVDQDQQDHRQALEQQALSVGRNTTAAATTGTATTATTAAAKVTRSSSSTSTSSALTIASSASATTTTATTTATTSPSQQQQNGDDHEDDIQFQADFLFQSPSYVRRNKAAPSATSSALSVPGRFVGNNENLNNCRDGRSTRRLPFVSYLKRRYVRKNGDNHNSESTVPLVNGRTRVTTPSSSATTSSAPSQQSPASTSSSSNIPLVAKTEPSDGTSPDTSIRSPGKRRLLPNKRLLEPESGDSDQQVIRKKKRPGRIHYPVPRPNPPPVTLSSPSSSTSTSPSKLMPLSQNRIYLCGESYRRTESRAQVRVLLDLAGPIKQETELADG